MLQMKHTYVKNVKFSKLNQAKYFHQKKINSTIIFLIKIKWRENPRMI